MLKKLLLSGNPIIGLGREALEKCVEKDSTKVFDEDGFFSVDDVMQISIALDTQN